MSFFFELEVLRDELAFAVLERVHHAAAEKVRRLLCLRAAWRLDGKSLVHLVRELLNLDRVQVEVGAWLPLPAARLVIARHEQHVVEPRTLQPIELRGYLVARTVLAGEVREGAHAVLIQLAGDGVGEYGRLAARIVRDGYRIDAPRRIDVARHLQGFLQRGLEGSPPRDHLARDGEHSPLECRLQPVFDHASPAS